MNLSQLTNEQLDELTEEKKSIPQKIAREYRLRFEINNEQIKRITI